MESESDKFLMVIALGSNGFIVTAYPRRIKNNPKDDASLSSKRARKADDTVRSLDAIQEIETPVAVLSSNIDDPMMIKDHGGALEYVSATDVVANNLASRVNAYGYQNRIRALSNGILNAKDEFIAMTIALEIRLTTGLETFLEIDGSFVSITRDYVESKLDNVLDTELERYPRLDTTDLSSPLK